MRALVNRLEIHAAHACNMTCESCSHFSNNHHSGVVSAETARQWSKAWNQRIIPSVLCVLGGEPTLNPGLEDFILTLAACWPGTQLQLYTNGWYVHRFPALGKLLGVLKVEVRVSIHSDLPEYASALSANMALLKQWSAEFGFKLSIEQSWENWTRRHHGLGADVLPFNDNQQRQSWEVCRARFCKQLFDGKLWKCSPLAYFQLQQHQFRVDREAWRLFLDYAPLLPDCSPEALAEFLKLEEESCCSLCPAVPEKFSKAMPVHLV